TRPRRRRGQRLPARRRRTGDIEMTRLVARLLLSAAAATLAVGCTKVGPDYQRPPMPSPPQYRFAEATTQAWARADLPWGQVFAAPGLQALGREAVMNNLDLRLAAARVEELRARAGIVKSFLYPQIDATASYSLFGTSSSQPDQDAVRQSG